MSRKTLIFSGEYRFKLFKLVSSNYKYILKVYSPYRNAWVELRYGCTNGKCNSVDEAYELAGAYAYRFE